MRAWLYTSTSGGLEHTIKLTDDVPLPTQSPANDEILVKVHYTSINPADYKVPELGMVARAVIPTPASPGMDFSGTVEKIGDAVTGLKVGDKVMGKVEKTRFGTLAEYIRLQYDGCASLPEGVAMDQASCVGTAGLTPYQCIVPHAKEGDKVFINGGSGGTGTFGIQIAKALGCVVTTSCSGRNVKLCRELGADEVIDYTKENVTEVLMSQGKVFKLVVDNVGNSPPDLYKAADDYMLPGGKFIQIGASATLASMGTLASRMLLPGFLGGRKHGWEFPVVKIAHDDFVQMGRWMAEGKVKALIDEVFEFEDAPKAFEKLKVGRTRGNLVIKVSE